MERIAFESHNWHTWVSDDWAVTSRHAMLYLHATLNSAVYWAIFCCENMYSGGFTNLPHRLLLCAIHYEVIRAVRQLLSIAITITPTQINQPYSSVPGIGKAVGPKFSGSQPTTLDRCDKRGEPWSRDLAYDLNLCSADFHSEAILG